MSKYGMGLVRFARLSRRQIIAFAILSAVVNGIVTAAVGAWLAETYAAHVRKTTAVQGLADLVYERRTRAGLVMWAVKRNAEIDELRYRKRAYDEAFVNWNKRIQYNIAMIRDISGQSGVTRIETQLQEMLVPALADLDACLTKAYDARVTGADGKPYLEACRVADLYQFTLDCAATITNELDRLTRVSFLPFSDPSETTRKAAEARIDRACQRPPAPLNADVPAPPLSSSAPAPAQAPPRPSALPPQPVVPVPVPATPPAKGPVEAPLLVPDRT